MVNYFKSIWLALGVWLIVPQLSGWRIVGLSMVATFVVQELRSLRSTKA